MASKKKAAKAQEVQAVSELEFWSGDLIKSDLFANQAFKWNVQEMLEAGMSMVQWGKPISGMVRRKDDVLAKVNQTATGYFTVKDYDAEVTRLEILGAEVFKNKTVIPGMGTWGYVKAPGGIIFGLWQSDPKHVPQPKKEIDNANTVTFLEIITDDAEDAIAYLEKAHGWKFNYSPFGDLKYWYCRGDEKTFSVGLRLPQKPEKGPNFIPYVNVDKISSALNLVTQGGGKKLTKGERSFGPFGTGYIFTDPGSVVLGLYEDSHEHHAHGKEAAKESHAKATAKKAAPAKKGAAAGKKKAAPAKKKTAAAKPKSKAKAAPKKPKTAAAAAKPTQGVKRERSSSAAASKRPAKKARK